MAEVFGILALCVVLISVLVERFFYGEQQARELESLLGQIQKLQTALISKSANEYATMVAIDKATEEKPTKQDDEYVETSQLSDEEYDKMIDRQNN